MYTVNMLLYFALSHCNCDAYMYMYKIVSLLVHVKLTSVEANKFQVYTLHRWKLPGAGHIWTVQAGIFIFSRGIRCKRDRMGSAHARPQNKFTQW